MKTRDFYFELPEELIAQEPPAVRGTSRLLLLERTSEKLRHLTLPELPELIPPGTTIVLNDSRVRKARLFATFRLTGGTVEFLFLDPLPGERWKVMVSKARKQLIGKEYDFPAGVTGRITGLDKNLRVMEFSAPLSEDYFEAHGHIPLPPYIKRKDKASDQSRYQTVYSRKTGSAAAPTAGLHFTPEILAAIKARGCPVVTVTLHVGLGTFLPIRSDLIEEHRMHEELYTVTPEAAATLNCALEHKSGILAVGTTVVRTLESAFADGQIREGSRLTGMYIYPGYRFNVVNHLLTNFHTPGSSLLVLVSAFAGRERIAAAYQTAIAEKYRFFSYGDAMLIL